MSASSAFWGVSSGSARGSRTAVTSDMVAQPMYFFTTSASRACACDGSPPNSRSARRWRSRSQHWSSSTCTAVRRCCSSGVSSPPSKSLCSSLTKCWICARTEASFSAAAMLAPRLVAAAARLVQEPDAPFRLVDPHLEEAGGGDIAALVAHAVRRAHGSGKPLVVFAQLGQHVERRDVLGIVVEHTLQPRDVPDRAHGRAADLAHALGDRVGDGEDLVRLLVEQQVVI